MFQQHGEIHTFLYGSGWSRRNKIPNGQAWRFLHGRSHIRNVSCSHSGHMENKRNFFLRCLLAISFVRHRENGKTGNAANGFNLPPNPCVTPLKKRGKGDENKTFGMGGNLGKRDQNPFGIQSSCGSPESRND